MANCSHHCNYLPCSKIDLHRANLLQPPASTTADQQKTTICKTAAYYTNYSKVYTKISTITSQSAILTELPFMANYLAGQFTELSNATTNHIATTTFAASTARNMHYLRTRC